MVLRIKWPALATAAALSVVVCSKDAVNQSSTTIQLSAYSLATGGVQKVTITVSAKDPDGNSLGTSEAVRVTISVGTLYALSGAMLGTGTSSGDQYFSEGGTFVAQIACPANDVVIKITAETRYKKGEQSLTCVADNTVGISLAIGATALSYGTSTTLTTTVTDTNLVSSDGGSNSNNKTITITQNPVLGSFSGTDVPEGTKQPSVDVPLYGGVGSVGVTYTAGDQASLTTITSCIKDSSRCAVLSNISIQNGRIVQLSSSLSTLTFGAIATVTANVKSGGVNAPSVPVKFEMYDLAGTFAIVDGGSGVTVTQYTDSQGNAVVTYTAGSTAYSSTTLKASIVGGLSSEYDTENVVIKEGVNLVLTTPASLPTSGVGDISLLVTQGTVDGGTPVSTPVMIRFSATPTDGGGTFSTDGVAAYAATLDKQTTQGTGIVTAKYKAGIVEGVQTVKAEVVGSTEQTTKGITITPAAVGSIEFCASDSTTTCGSYKSTPDPLILGVIGSRKPQQAQLYFMVKNELGQAYTDGQSVTFTLSEVSNTGARLVTTTATTANGTGLVATTLTAGSNLQNVTVTATTGFGNQTRSVSSQRISVVGGVPTINKSNMACTSASTSTKIVSGGYSNIGVAFACSAYLGDRFGNIADPSQVNFLTEAGLVTASSTSDAIGVASVSGYSLGTGGGPSSSGMPYYWGPKTVATDPGAGRPENGLVTIIAFTRGEEYFYDRNSNGILDTNASGGYDKCPLSGKMECANNPTDGGIVANDCYCDIMEPFVDKNDNGTFDPVIAEEFRDAPPEDGGFDLGNNKWDNDNLIWFDDALLFTVGDTWAQAFLKTGATCEASAGNTQEFGPLASGASAVICVRFLDGNNNCTGVGGTFGAATDPGDLKFTQFTSTFSTETKDYCFSAFWSNPAKLPYIEMEIQNTCSSTCTENKAATVTVSRSGGTPAGGPTKVIRGSVMVAP